MREQNKVMQHQLTELEAKDKARDEKLAAWKRLRTPAPAVSPAEAALPSRCLSPKDRPGLFRSVLPSVLHDESGCYPCAARVPCGEASSHAAPGSAHGKRDKFTAAAPAREATKRHGLALLPGASELALTAKTPLLGW